MNPRTNTIAQAGRLMDVAAICCTGECEQGRACPFEAAPVDSKLRARVLRVAAVIGIAIWAAVYYCVQGVA